MSNINIALGPTSYHPFHGITEFIDGEPCAVPFDRDLLTKIFLNDMSPDKYNINFDEWRNQRKSGVVLTTSECIKYMQKEFNREWGNLLIKTQKSGKLYLFNDKKYCQRKASEIARKLSIYVNKVSKHDWDYNMSTDLFHGFNTHMLYSSVWLLVFSHCILLNDVSDSIFVIDSIGLPWLTKAAKEYLDLNRSRSLDNAWNLTSNGHNYKLICNNLYCGYLSLSWTAHDKLEIQLQDSGVTIHDLENNNNVNIDMSFFVPMLKIASQYVAHKNIRRAFSIFWSSTTDKHNGDGLPPTVKKLKYHLNKSFWNLLNFSAETVCQVRVVNTKTQIVIIT